MPDEAVEPNPEEESRAIVEPQTVTASADSRPGNIPSVRRSPTFGVGVAITPKPSADETIAEKMNAGHIVTLLENSDNSDKRAWIDGLVERGQSMVVLLAVLVLIGLLCRWTIDQKQYEMAEKIVIAFLGFAGGFGARSFTDKKKKPKED